MSNNDDKRKQRDPKGIFAGMDDESFSKLTKTYGTNPSSKRPINQQSKKHDRQNKRRNNS
jgi:hypothetical protein